MLFSKVFVSAAVVLSVSVTANSIKQHSPEVQSETCGSHFIRFEEDCKNAGYVGAGNSSRRCVGNSCTLSKCCAYAVPQLTPPVPKKALQIHETCGSHFINFEFECKRAGLIGAGDSNKACVGKKCTLRNCCAYSVPQKIPPISKKVSKFKEPETCGSHFINFDYDCKSAGLIGAGDADKACVGKKCTLENCCAYSVPQKTPSIPKKASREPETCGSHFINFDYECKKAGLIGAGDADKPCVGKKCTLENCCAYSVSQKTPPVPKKASKESETCGSHFINFDYECKSAGLIEAGDFDKACVGKKCTLENCCAYSVPQKTPSVPKKASKEPETCGSHFINFDYECKSAGLTGAGDADKTCVGKRCTLENCCAYSVPQKTPPIPKKPSKEPETCGSHFNNFDYECKSAGLMGAGDVEKACVGKKCTLKNCCKFSVPQITPPIPKKASKKLETCGSHFINFDYECKIAGLMGAGDVEKACVGKKCTLENCCAYSIPQKTPPVPKNASKELETCGSHFINFDYECKSAGLIGAGDAEKACVGKKCTLKNCCKFSVPQITPPIPKKASKELETCGSHFINFDYECKIAGLMGAGDAEKACVGKKCTLENCCAYSIPQKTPPVPKNASKELETCGSHFINFDYECKSAGLIGAGDAEKACVGKKCTLKNCCKFSVPQITPPIPKKASKELETCGSHFINFDYECKIAGLMGAGDAEKACVGKKCTLENCCAYSFPQKTPPVPKNASRELETCGSHFINFDYECKSAGLIGAGDADKACIGKKCTLKNCCKFSVPQMTPPIPKQASKELETCGSHFINFDYECKVAGLMSAGDAEKTCVGKKCTLENCCAYSIPQKTPPVPKNASKEMETCGSHFINFDYECKSAGLIGAGDADKACVGKKCTLKNCCKHARHKEKGHNGSTCVELYNSRGRNVCVINGFAKRRRGRFQCLGEMCTIAECCKHPITKNRHHHHRHRHHRHHRHRHHHHHGNQQEHHKQHNSSQTA